MSLSGTTRWDHPHPVHTTGIVHCCDSANAPAAKHLKILYEFGPSVQMMDNIIMKILKQARQHGASQLLLRGYQ